MAKNLDTLEIKITSNAQSANRALTTLEHNLNKVATSLGNLGTNSKGLNQFAKGVSALSNAMLTMKNSGVGTADFTRLIKNLTALANIDSAGIDMTARSFDKMGQAMGNVAILADNADNIETFTKALSKLGNKGVTQAIDNLPRLTDSIKNLLLTLNEMPAIRDDVLRMTEALAELAKAGKRFDSKSMSSENTRIKISFDYASKALDQFASKVAKLGFKLAKTPFKVFGASVKGIANVVQGAVSKIKAFGNQSEKSTKSVSNFAQAIGTLYVKFWLLARVLGKVWTSVKSSFDYLETVNYFTSSFQAIAKRATETMSDAGEKSAEAFYDSYTKTAYNLNRKLTGMDVSGGNLELVSGANLGLDPNTTLNAQATFAQIANSMGVATDKAVMLSNALTMIGADLASVKNVDFADAWQDMSSALVGMSRAVDKYGINIRASAMQEKLAQLGINKTVKELSQADKALLRTIMILDASKYAWSDLAETLNSPANQIRMLTANLKKLAMMFGSLFLPILKKVLPYINAVVIALQRLIQTIAKALGIDLSSMLSKGGGGSDALSDVLDESEELGENLDEDADSAKKLKNNLLGIDELNIIGDNSDQLDLEDMTADSLLDQAFLDALEEYQNAWEDAFSKLENKAQEIADKIVEWAKKVWKPIGEAWDAVGEKVKAQFKDMVEEVGKLLKDIARDWARVWESDSVEKTFEHIFKSFGNIFEMVGNLAKQFREAWNEGEKGYHILQTIADIIERITAHIEKMTASWAEWASHLNFNPILQSILDLLTAIKDNADDILDIFDSFQTLFMQPAIKYAVEEFFPKLLNVLRDLVNDIDWGKLKGAFADIFTGLEKITEFLGDTFLDKLSKFEKFATELINTYLPRLGEGFKKLGEDLKNAKDINDIIDAIFDFADGRVIDASEIINMITKAFNEAFEKIDFRKLGDRVGQLINKIFSTINWTELGKAVSNLATGFLDFINNAIAKIDWFKVGQSIGNFLKGIDWKKILLDVLSIIGNVLNGLWSAWLGSMSTAPFETAVATALGAVFAGNKISKLLTGKGILSNLLGSLFGSNSELGEENTLFEKIFGSAKKASTSKGLFASANADVASSVKTTNGLLPMELEYFGQATSKAGAVAKALGGIALVAGGTALAGIEFGKQWKEGVTLAQSALMALGVVLAGIGAVLLGAPATVVAVIGAIVFAVAELVLVIHQHWDEIVAWTQQMFDNIGQKWQSFKDNVAQSWEEFKTNIATKWQEIKDGFNTFIEEWGESIKRWASEKWDDILNKLEEVREWIATKWFEMHQNFAEHIKVWHEKITEWATTKWEEITNKLEDIRQKIADKWSEMWKNFDDHISQWHDRIQRWATERWDEITKKLEFVRDFIQERWQEMWGHFEEHISRWREYITEWATSRWEEITERMDYIKEQIWQRWELMKADFDDFKERWKEKISEWASERWDEVINAMQQLRDQIVEKWENFKADFTNFLHDWWDLIGQWAQERWQSVIDTFDKLKTGIKEKWDAIKDEARSFWDNFKTDLGSWAKSASDAIVNAFSSLKDKLSSTWSSIKSGAQSALGSLSSTASNVVSSVSSTVSKAISSVTSSSSSAKKTTTTTVKGASGTNGGASKTTTSKSSGTSLAIDTNKMKATSQASTKNTLGNFVSNVVSSVSGAVDNVKKKLGIYATGGFPEDGLFFANHTELVGRFNNGKTAVANNQQITEGIAQATYQAIMRANQNNNGREEELLQELINAVRAGNRITIDGREIVTAYDNRKTRNGYSFT